MPAACDPLLASRKAKMNAERTEQLRSTVADVVKHNGADVRELAVLDPSFYLGV